MQQILYATDWRVPSWSWMAYAGQIEYMGIQYYRAEWNEGVRLADGVLKVTVRSFRSCTIERKDDETCDVEDENGHGERGWVKFDGADSTDVQTLRCVIIGRDKDSNAKHRYYVLAVTPICLEGCRAFGRVGVGSIPQSFISPAHGAVDAHIQ